MNPSRDATRIHQIEMTSRCNLRCPYCVSPNLGRPKVDMAPDVWRSALDHVRWTVKSGFQDELNLAGIGESTMHPDFCEWVLEARQAAPHIRLVLATNGIGFEQRFADACRMASVCVWVSLHRPEHAKEAVDGYKAAGVLWGFSVDGAMASMDWAGQVDWPVTAPKNRPCQWWRDGRVMVMASGEVTTCCLDGSGTGVVGHVFEDMGAWKLGPYDLCKSCDQRLGIPGWDQRMGRLTNAERPYLPQV